MRVLVIPQLVRYLIPAIVTATGLAWKSEIAAEIIAYTRNSIGQNINDAKFNMDSPTVFAWTIIVIALSIILELIAKLIMRRCKKWALN
jgi:NitT/TauT family transport system permease protein